MTELVKFIRLNITELSSSLLQVFGLDIMQKFERGHDFCAVGVEEYGFKIAVIKVHSLETYTGIHLFTVLLFKSCTSEIFSVV